MKKRARRDPPKPVNLAARALGSKIFGLKVVTPKTGYTRKSRHKDGALAAAALGTPGDEAD